MVSEAPVAGDMRSLMTRCALFPLCPDFVIDITTSRYIPTSTDWPEQETTLAALTGAAGAQPGAGVGQQLWEDNWDDDDVEVAFTTQLRWVSVRVQVGWGTDAASLKGGGKGGRPLGMHTRRRLANQWILPRNLFVLHDPPCRG